MRRFLILVMVLLLPLRGWAGDLMGIQMAVMETAKSASAVMPPGCPMHAQVEVVPDSGDMQVPAGSAQCTSCDLCIPLAAVAEFPAEVCTHAVHTQPLMAGVDFDSVPPALALKPPIS